jgi:hypothetical protein
MRADICGADDPRAIGRFRDVLQKLGADLSQRDWAIGVDVYRLRIGAEEITIYSDAWSVDIDGPEELVGRIRAALTGA